jgi:hypothetical protein
VVHLIGLFFYRFLCSCRHRTLFIFKGALLLFRGQIVFLVWTTRCFSIGVLVCTGLCCVVPCGLYKAHYLLTSKRYCLSLSSFHLHISYLSYQPLFQIILINVTLWVNALSQIFISVRNKMHAPHYFFIWIHFLLAYSFCFIFSLQFQLQIIVCEFKRCFLRLHFLEFCVASTLILMRYSFKNTWYLYQNCKKCRLCCWR